MPLLYACRKMPAGFSASFLQSAARIISSSMTKKFHTFSLISILRQVHAPAQNILNFVFRLCGKFCEAFGTV